MLDPTTRSEVLESGKGNGTPGWSGAAWLPVETSLGESLVGKHESWSGESVADAFFDRTPVPTLLLSETGIIHRINRAALDYFGLPPERVLNRSLGELVGCLDFPGQARKCGTHLACPTCAVGATLLEAPLWARASNRREVRQVVRRKGVPYEAFLRVSTSRVAFPDRECVMMSLEDVTDLRRAELAAREQGELLAASDDATCVVDLQGQVERWSPGAERLYGWTQDQAIHRMLHDLLFGGNPYAWYGLRQMVMSVGRWDGELQPLRADRQTLSVRIRANLVRSPEGQPREIILVATDQTEKRQLQQQLLRAQRLESVGILACGIAHDLNNVLTPVQMVAELLRPAVAGSENERFLDLLSRSALRGVEIIRQLLLYGRGMEGVHTALDLRSLVKETIKIAGETFPKSIIVVSEVPAEACIVKGDATQIHQVLVNLCVNARDAMPEGGRLTVSVEKGELSRDDARLLGEGSPGTYVILRVSDTGTGIPNEIRSRIFDPFFTTKPPGQGTGLGLSTVRDIVRGHRGFIEVRSEPRNGSVFSVFLPVAEKDTPEAPPVPPTAIPRGENEWILLVEDEEAIRELVRETLVQWGYRVVVAVDGAEAIAVFGRHHGEIAAVVIDMMLPLIEGGAAIRSFRRLEPGIEIVAMSGLPAQRDEASRAAAGRCAFLQKPFRPDELLLELDRALRPKRAGAKSGADGVVPGDPP